MRKMWVSYEGQVINVNPIIEKMREAIEKTMGVLVDEMDECEALFAAANVAGKSIPELLGI